jgi:hypothetical protein
MATYWCDWVSCKLSCSQWFWLHVIQSCLWHGCLSSCQTTLSVLLWSFTCQSNWYRQSRLPITQCNTYTHSAMLVIPRTLKSSLDFLVCWEGYHTANDLWLHGLATSQTVHQQDYCRCIPELRSTASRRLDCFPSTASVDVFPSLTSW